MKKILPLALFLAALIPAPAWPVNLSVTGAHFVEWDFEAPCVGYNLYWSTSNPPVWDKSRSVNVPQPAGDPPPASVDYDLLRSLSVPSTYWLAATCYDLTQESGMSNVVPFCLDHSSLADTDSFTGFAGTCPCLTFIAAPIGGNTDKIGSAGGPMMARVLNGPSCIWTATALNPWITIDPGFLTGVGDGWTKYIVQANTTGAQRKGIISVNGKYLVITQSK